MQDDPEEPRRYLIATAIAQYDKAPQWDRPGLVGARQRVVDLFTQDLGYQHVSELGLNPTEGQLTRLLRDFCRHEDRRPDDIVAVYIGGHGEILETTQEHVLLTSDTDPADIDDALQTARLARKMLLGTSVRRILLMLDTCYSGRGGNELTAAAISSMIDNWDDESETGLAVITSTQPFEQAGTGAFPQLLHDAVHNLATGGNNPATLPLDSLVKAMNANAAKPGYQTIQQNISRMNGEVPPFLPNPRYQPGMSVDDLAIGLASEFEFQAERREEELRTHLLPRAKGGLNSPGWWFAGRHAALTDIATWLDQPTPAKPMLAVAGDPGSGKTAVLGLVTALTHPERRVTVPVNTLELPDAAMPASGSVDVAIYARNLTTGQVLRGIAAAVRLDAATLGELLSQLTGRSSPVTVLIDALDEAVDPDDLTRRLLRPLAEAAAGRVRLLVGTRSYLLGQLGTRREDTIDLDAERYADIEAITAYAARGLREMNTGSPYRTAPPELVGAVADAIAAASQPSFLVARITSVTLAAQPEVADPRDRAWREALPRVPGEAMRRDLESRLSGDAPKVRDLLRPLAFAEGNGLPWEDIWPAVASKATGITYADDDLLWLRRQAGSYFVEASEGGRSAYRLYHQALTEHLREDVDPRKMHQAISDVLLSLVPRTPDDQRDWSRAHPYTLQHLATHAAAAGKIDLLVADAEFLVYAEPEGLLLALHETTTDEGALVAAVYRCSSDIHRALPPFRRRLALAIDAARFRAGHVLRDLSTNVFWPPRWATGRQVGQALYNTFADHTGPVLSVACATLDGAPVAVTTGVDETARVWNLASSEEVTTFTEHTDSVLAVACTTVDDDPVAVTGSSDQTARVWNLATGDQIAVYEHGSPVRSVACAALNGDPVAVTTSENIARVWNLNTGKEIASWAERNGAVLAAACTTIEGQPAAVTTSDRGFARVWNMDTGDVIATLYGHTDSVGGVACTVLDGQPVAITISGDDAVVWNLISGQEINTFTNHTGSVFAVSCTVLNGRRPVAITASRDGTARVWDVASSLQYSIFTNHSGSVFGVDSTTLNGLSVAVTASLDATARVWRIQTSPGPSAEQTGHSGSINAVACGLSDSRPITVTTSDDDTARVWDLADGTPITMFTNHTDPVLAVACTMLGDQPVAVTTSDDGTAGVWDLTNGDEGTTFTSHQGAVLAVSCATVENHPVAVTTGEDGTARVWRLAGGEEITTFTGHSEAVLAVTCTTLGDAPVAITTSDDDTALVWDLRTGTGISAFTGHSQAVRAVACTTLREAPVAVTASEDGTARVWNLATGQAITTFTGHIGPVTAVACGAVNGRPIAITAGDDDSVRVWDLATADEIGIFNIRGVACLTTGPAGEVVIGAGLDIVVLDHPVKH